MVFMYDYFWAMVDILSIHETSRTLRACMRTVANSYDVHPDDFYECFADYPIFFPGPLCPCVLRLPCAILGCTHFSPFLLQVPNEEVPATSHPSACHGVLCCDPVHIVHRAIAPRS